MTAASLSVSVVTFAPDVAVVEDTLRSLALSLEHAFGGGDLGTVQVNLVDNGPGEHVAPVLSELMAKHFKPPVQTALLTGHGNVGYGRGHNLALLAGSAEYHMVLNPDVVLAPDAIHEALAYMNVHPDVVMLAPEARDMSGNRLFLCKRYPSVTDLLLRSFAPGSVKRLFRARLDHYEMRDLPRALPSVGIPILSGSFMFCRRVPIAAIGGFSEAFFLYFEDFDLSLRSAKQGALAYVPSVRIVHRGGNAARKGLKHIVLFMRSALTFFNRHGWKWV